MAVELVEVTRTGLVESIHRGHIAVVDTKGNVLFSVGNPEHITFFRSTGKPIIAIAALESGIVEEYKLDMKEIAIISSSHSGEKEHIEVLNSIMKKININEDYLKCGAVEPTGKEAAKELLASGGKPTKLHCNCSAKHMGVIAAARIKGLELDEYYVTGHPVQKYVEEVISEFSGVNGADILKGVDGCGITVYAVPLRNMALAYANLCNEGFMDGKYRKSQNYVVSSMTMYPEMVAGKGRLDTELMKRFGNRILGKFGAEGVYCAGILGKGIGIAVKIEDGNSRAVGPAVLDTLLQMGVLDKNEIEQLMDFWRPAVLNHRGEKVGEIRPAFRIRKE